MVHQPFYSLRQLSKALEVDCHVEGVVFATEGHTYKWNFREKVRGVLWRKDGQLLSAERKKMATTAKDRINQLVECTYGADGVWREYRKCLDRVQAHSTDELHRIATVASTHIPIDELFSLVRIKRV